jgi:hypothetical protein
MQAGLCGSTLIFLRVPQRQHVGPPRGARLPAAAVLSA